MYWSELWFAKLRRRCDTLHVKINAAVKKALQMLSQV